MLDMVHHPWVELYRMRRSMRQINLAAAAPTAATSTFTTSQVAAATAAAGAAIGAAGVSASCPSLANLSQLLQVTPQAAAGQGSSADVKEGANSSAGAATGAEQQGPLSAAAAAAAALSAVKKNLKQTVANKMIAGAHALQGTKAPEVAKLETKEELHFQLSSASSPCLLNAGKARAPTNLLKAAVAGNMAAAATTTTGPAVPPTPPSPATPAAVPPPGPLHKGGSLKLDADARTFLFAGAFGSSCANSTAAKSPAGQLTAGVATTSGPLTAAAAKQQQVAQHGAAGKLQSSTDNFRAAY